jgi:hypothetical protein
MKAIIAVDHVLFDLSSALGQDIVIGQFASPTRCEVTFGSPLKAQKM